MIILLVFLLIYIICIVFIILGNVLLPETDVSDYSKAITGFSIVIPFKNESKNLPLLLTSIERIHYPQSLFEIIMIDDGSTDNSVAIIKQSKLNIILLSNQKLYGFGKKKALFTGIRKAKNSWIVTTDADCQLPTDWLLAYDAVCRSKDVKIVLGPVRFFDETGFLQQFQQIEFLSLQAITMAGIFWKKPFLANGANMAYRKDAFIQLNGFQGNEQIASGDDVFLLEKISQNFPGKYAFVKNKTAIVKTQAQSNFKELLHQKIRWGSKTKNYKSLFPKLFGILMLIINLLLLLSFVLIPKFYALLFVSGKIISDIVLVLHTNRFYHAKINPFTLFIGTFLYPFYFILVFLFSLKGNYRWKGVVYKNND